MNNETYTPSIYQPTRKAGYIVEFSESNDDYLKAISNDLTLDATIDEMHRLQAIFKDIARMPTVADLYFALAGLRKGVVSAGANPTFKQIAGCSPEALKLFIPFMRKYRDASKEANDAPSLASLAEYAASGRVNSVPCGIEICRADSVIMPLPYSGVSETVKVDEYLATFSTGKPLSGESNAEVCVILSPQNGEDCNSFTEKAHRICRKLFKEFPDTKIISASDRGLICDLLNHGDGFLIDTALFTNPKYVAESVFDAFNPSLILFLSRNALMKLWHLSAEEGILIKAAVSARTNLITVQAAEGTVQFEKSFFKLLKADNSVTVDYNENASPAKSEVILERKLTSSEHILTAKYVGGEHLYEDIADAMDDKDAVFAVTGTVSATDGRFIQSILALDSYRRNCSPTVVFSRFFNGDKTQICILKLKAEK